MFDQDEAAISEGEEAAEGLEEVFVFDSNSGNRDRTVEAVEAVSEARAEGLGLDRFFLHKLDPGMEHG